MSLDLTTLITRTWPALHAANAADSVFWSDAELTRYYAEHLKRLAQKSGMFVERDTLSITFATGVALYDCPTRHLSTLHVAVENRPLVASSTKEAELRDSQFQTRQVATGGRVRDWYEDKAGANRIGFRPVPSAAFVGLHPEILYHRFPCNLDIAHTSVTIDAPAVVGDYLWAVVVAEAYGREGDCQMPEVAESCKALGELIEAVCDHYWGGSQ